MEFKINMKLVYKIIFASLIGATMGYLYFYFIGCNSGTCAITSKPTNSTLYGAFMGFMWYIPEIWLKKEK